MPAAFVETTLGTPVFKVLLGFLPAMSLYYMAACKAGLRTEVSSADHVWTRLWNAAFGGDVALARRLCPRTMSPHSLFSTFTRLRNALGAVEVVRGDLADACTLGVEAIVCPAVPFR